jgi:hypothetical protein
MVRTSYFLTGLQGQDNTELCTAIGKVAGFNASIVTDDDFPNNSQAQAVTVFLGRKKREEHVGSHFWREATARVFKQQGNFFWTGNCAKPYLPYRRSVGDSLKGIAEKVLKGTPEQSGIP